MVSIGEYVNAARSPSADGNGTIGPLRNLRGTAMQPQIDSACLSLIFHLRAAVRHFMMQG